MDNLEDFKKRIAVAVAVFDLLALLFFKVQFWHLKHLISCFGRGICLIYEAVVLLFTSLYYYRRNFCNLIGLEQWYFSLI